MSLLFRAEVRLRRMDISSASISVMFMACRLSWFVIELLAQMCTATDATFDFLMPLSVMTAILCGEACDCLKALLSFCMCKYVSSSDEKRGEWKIILLEK